AAMPRGLDVVNHVADKCRLRRVQIVRCEDFTDLVPLVHDLDVGELEGIADAERAGLRVEMGCLDRAQQENAPARALAEIEEFPRTGQKNDIVVKTGEK